VHAATLTTAGRWPPERVCLYSRLTLFSPAPFSPSLQKVSSCTSCTAAAGRLQVRASAVPLSRWAPLPHRSALGHSLCSCAPAPPAPQPARTPRSTRPAPPRAPLLPPIPRQASRPAPSLTESSAACAPCSPSALPSRTPSSRRPAGRPAQRRGRRSLTSSRGSRPWPAPRRWHDAPRPPPPGRAAAPNAAPRRRSPSRGRPGCPGQRPRFLTPTGALVFSE
jgi:hypothetical protein